MNIAQYLEQIDRVNAEGPFHDDWNSLSAHQTPQWYKSGKFGLFIHWGVYSVPAFESEWYPRLMYLKGSKSYLHHIKTYGGVNKFPYKNFVPMFTADKFNADEWLSLFKQSGAKYIMPVGEHHDGFKMYESDLNRWNAVQMGPKKDILKELHEACDKYDIGFLTSSHRAEHYWFLNGSRDFDCDIRRGEDRDFYGPCYATPGQSAHEVENTVIPPDEWLEDWLASTCEMIDRTQPLAIYFDWWVRHKEFRPYMKKFLAYYYNRGVQWGKQVTVFYKNDGIMKGCATFDVERGQLDSISSFIWQNDTAIAKNSWGYTEGNKFKTAGEVISNLLDAVSKNGCFMLNVGPKADGTVCAEEKEVLLKIGAWLKVNGEAIYDSEPYNVYGEAKKKQKHGAFKENFKYTSADIRFTYKTGVVYAFALGYNKKNCYDIKSLAYSGEGTRYVVKKVTLLGYDNSITFDVNGKRLQIKIGGNFPAPEAPICFKIEID